MVITSPKSYKDLAKNLNFRHNFDVNSMITNLLI